MEKATSIDAYISQCDVQYQALLQQLKQYIQKYAPEASEKISYGMPTFYYHGNLVHFALAKHHIGFYPTPNGIYAFEKQFKKRGLKYSKGTVQFPLNQEMPWDLIAEIVTYRVAQNKDKK